MSFHTFDGAQYIYLLFISYEPRTINKTADVRIVFSQQQGSNVCFHYRLINCGFAKKEIAVVVRQVRKAKHRMVSQQQRATKHKLRYGT
jgi:hypothetical protein